MPENTVKKWEGVERQPFDTKIKEAFHPSGSLKSRLDLAVSRVEAQVRKLDQTTDRLSERDKSLFSRVVDAYSKHDQTHANVFASELAEVRKTEKIVMNTRLALEQIVLRLKTVTEVGDMVSSLAPVITILGSVKKAIAGVLPDSGRELEQIGTMLSGIIADAGQTPGLNFNFDAPNEDAQKILTEAATLAEQKMKDKFPELPAGTTTASDSTKTRT